MSTRSFGRFDRVSSVSHQRCHGIGTRGDSTGCKAVRSVDRTRNMASRSRALRGMSAALPDNITQQLAPGLALARGAEKRHAFGALPLQLPKVVPVLFRKQHQSGQRVCVADGIIAGVSLT